VNDSFRVILSSPWRSQFFSSFSTWRLRRRASYLAQSWEVRMRWPSCDFFTVTDFYLDIEVEGFVDDVKQRSYYYVLLYVGDIKVAESKKSMPQSSVRLELEWKENNQMWVILWLCSTTFGWSPLKISFFEPSSTVKIELYRRYQRNPEGFFKALVGKHEGQVVELLVNGE
jgi:hypothetical protein